MATSSGVDVDRRNHKTSGERGNNSGMSRNSKTTGEIEGNVAGKISVTATGRMTSVTIAARMIIMAHIIAIAVIAMVVGVVVGHHTAERQPDCIVV